MVGHYRFDSDVGGLDCQVRYNRLFRGESRIYPGVAQLGSAIASGAMGHRFKSCYPDFIGHYSKLLMVKEMLFVQHN